MRKQQPISTTKNENNAGCYSSAPTVYIWLSPGRITTVVQELIIRILLWGNGMVGRMGDGD